MSSSHRPCHTLPWRAYALLVALLALVLPASAQPGRALLLDGATLIDGTGSAPMPNARIVVRDGRIVAAGAADQVTAPPDAETIDLTGRTVVPGLIDLHFHIERDPRLALRQLAHGVTSFRDPGQWEEQFAELRQLVAAEGLAGPRIFTAGPHIDGERPAYPADAVVARDAIEARRLAERNIAEGATSIKIYFRLPLAGVRSVIDVCHARGVPCTAHLEILDAARLFDEGLHGIEHITSLGFGLLPRRTAEKYRQAVLAENDARREGRYELFAGLDLDGPEAKRLYEVLGRRRPWVDPTLAVFERRSQPLPKGVTAAQQQRRVAGFEQMKRLTRRAAEAGARVVMGGHTEVPFAGRGEAPWRELELLVESGFTPLEALQAATSTAAAFLYQESDLGTVAPGRRADLVVLGANPADDIRNIRRVERVLLDGQWVDVARYRTF